MFLKFGRAVFETYRQMNMLTDRHTDTLVVTLGTVVDGEVTRRPASADRTARRQFQAGLRGDVGL